MWKGEGEGIEEYQLTRTDIDDDINDMIMYSNEIYPITPDFDLWESFLGRNLNQEERKIIHDYLLENDTNLQIKSLHYNLILNGFYSIPKLTKNNGNCLFESLEYLGYGKTREIRKNIAVLLLSVKNDWNFFPGMNSCPEELFLNCNDVEVVQDKNTNKVYEYDYNAMIVDLYTNHSWSRLPMELILMAISRLYEIHIKIFSNKSEYVHMITCWDPNDLDYNTIYLGHINEEHYIPIIKILDEIISEPQILEEEIKSYPKYISAKNAYHKWGKQMASSFGLEAKPVDNNSLHEIKLDGCTTDPELWIDLDQIKNFDEFEIIQ
jgi:hypothetical protein